MENTPIQMSLAKIKSLSNQSFNGIRIILVVEGEIFLKVNQENYTLEKNDFLLLNRHDMVSMQGHDSNIVLLLKVSLEYLQKECEEFLQYKYICSSKQPELNQSLDSDEIRRILIHMMLVYCRQTEGYQLDVRASTFQLLHFIMVNYKKLNQDIYTQNTKNQDKRITSALAYINENYRHDISLDAIAQRAFVTTHYFSKLFKKNLGMGYQDYINKIRLENATQDLMYTDKSIIKVALLNGFASVKSFNNVFKKKYGLPPKKFKQINQQKTFQETQEDYEKLSINNLEGFPELVKYLQVHGNTNKESKKTDVIHYHVDIDQQRKKINPLKNILRIGKLSDALLVETQNQLNYIQSKLKCDYIHFQGIFGDGIHQYGEQSFYYYYDYNQAVYYFKNLGLIPFIRINVSDIVHAQISVEKVGEILTSFLQSMSKYFSKNYVTQWLFEVMHFDDISIQEYLTYYQKIYQSIRKFSPEIKIGLFSVDRINHLLLERFRTELEFCKKNHFVPNFVTFKAEPNISDDSIGMYVDSHKRIQNFHSNLIEHIQSIITDCHLAEMPLYATEWNTIAGKKILDVGSFYRAALIFKEMLNMSVNKNIHGLAFWLSDQSRERIMGVNHATLSLFHCAMAKRAAFYVLQAFSWLGTDILFQNEHIIISQNKQNDYVILVLNPCYFNPIHSVDYEYILDYEKKFSIEIDKIKPHLYQFKIHHFKMNYSFAINSQKDIHKVFDLPAFKYNNEEMLEHIEHIAAPEFTVYEKNISNTLHFTPSLSFNSMILYTLRTIK